MAAEAVVAVVEVAPSEDGNFLTYFKSKQDHCQPVSTDSLSSFASTCMIELLSNYSSFISTRNTSENIVGICSSTGVS